VEGAADDTDIEFGEFGQGLFEKGPSRFSDRRVGGGQVPLVGWTQSGRDRDAIGSSGAADFHDMRRAIAVQMMSGDFDHVETELGDFLDVFQVIGAPLLLPVRVINAEFQLRLHFEKRCGRSLS
jgi:hypothetical protein